MFKFHTSILTFLLLSIFASNSWSEELLVYSGRKAKFLKPLVKEFTSQTGIKVKLVSGNSSILLSRLSLQDKKTDVDLYISNDAGNLQTGSVFGLFQKLPENITNV